MPQTKITLPWPNFNGMFAGFMFKNSQHVTGFHPNDQAVVRLKSLLGGTKIEAVPEPETAKVEPTEAQKVEALQHVLNAGYSPDAAKHIVEEYGAPAILVSKEKDAEEAAAELAARTAPILPPVELTEVPPPVQPLPIAKPATRQATPMPVIGVVKKPVK